MERYEIIIKGKATSKKKTNVSGEDEKEKKTNVAGEDGKEQEDKQKSAHATVKMIAKTSLNEAKALIVPNIGVWSRNSLLQERVDDTINLIDTAISFAIHPVYGLINFSTKMAGKLIQYSVQNEKEQNRLTVALRRASYINRSRE